MAVVKRGAWKSLTGRYLLLGVLVNVIRENGLHVFVALWVATSVVGVVFANHLDRNERILERVVRSQHRALNGSCERVNALRRNQNAQAVQRYQEDQVAAKLLERQPQARRVFTTLAKQIRWTPLTNCKSAVNTPEQFEAPVPQAVWSTPLYLIPQ